MGREQHTWRMLRLTGQAVTRCMHCGVAHEYLTRRSRQGICQPVIFPPGFVPGGAQGVEVEVFNAGLIPLPGTGGDEQTKNARLLADAGGAVLIREADCSPARLLAALTDLLASERRTALVTMGTAARTQAPADAAGRLADELLALRRSR